MSLIGKNIEVTVSINPQSGASLNQKNTIVAEVLDYAMVEIGPDSADVQIDLNETDQMIDSGLLIVMASAYPGGLSYKIESDSNQSLSLRNPHFYCGAGQIESTNLIPNKLFITNSSNSSITFTVIIARKALVA